MILTSKPHVIQESGSESDDQESYKSSEGNEEIESETNSISNDEENSSNEEILEDDSDNDGTKNLAWADAVNKILKSKSPKNVDTIVLSKAKKLTEIKPPKEQPVGFEVELKDGEVKQETVEIKADVVTKTKKRKRKELPCLRKKPNVLEKDREKLLSKIATKGVVQLFNAVKNQQQQLKSKLEEAGPLEIRKEKVMKSMDKNTFLDKLMSEKSENVEETIKKSASNRVKKENETQEKLWSVLRNDFMMGAKLKDWDKEPEIETENENVEMMYESD